jgi:spore coat protein CotH
MKLTGLLVLFSGCLFWVTAVPRIELTLAQDSIDLLEIDPFDDDAEVHGDVTVNNDTVYNDVMIHYRGAYYLYNLIEYEKKQRNWKLKFSRENKYRNRREWNFNYEPHLRQKTCYDLFKAAGVAVPSARHVELFINGDSHGPYLEYEDPDDKQWLFDTFGDKSGDLYKAAYDKPDEPSFFALLTDLGDSSSDYYMHYDKKTNENGDDSLDYRSLINFIKMVNYTSDEQFPDTIRKYFEVESFLRYLVIVNFTLNWDSYPTRPKNYWLYNNPTTGKWIFIPWDLDLTFQRKRTGDIILDTDLSIFYQLDEYEPFKGQENEGTERPLVRRMMKLGDFRDKYIREYRQALLTYLQIDTILAGIDASSSVVKEILQTDDSTLVTYQKSVAALERFVQARYERVSGQLLQLGIHDSREKRRTGNVVSIPGFSVQSRKNGVVVSCGNRHSRKYTVSVNDLMGRELFTLSDQETGENGNYREYTVPLLTTGMYLVTIRTAGNRHTERILIK